MAGMCGKDCGNCETRQRNGCRGYPDCSGCDARTSCGKPEEAEEARRRWTAEEGECRNRMRSNKKERTHKASALFMYDIRGNQSWHRPAVMMAME